MVHRYNFHVRFLDGHHLFEHLQYPRRSTEMAQQSISNRICIRYINREHEKLFSAREATTLSGHKNSLPAMLRYNSPFIDLVHCVMNFAVAIPLKYDMQFFQT